MILSERLARQLGAKPGDTVRVPTSQGVQELSVLLVDDSYGYFPHPDERLYGVVADRHFAEHHCLDTTLVGDAAIVLRPGTDPRPIEAALRAAHPDRRLSVEWGPDIRDHHVADLARDFALFDLILGLTAILAALGVLNGQLLAALERAKEVGILRALGATRRQLAGTVLIEALVTGALGGLVGTALGAALIPVVWLLMPESPAAIGTTRYGEATDAPPPPAANRGAMLAIHTLVDAAKAPIFWRTCSFKAPSSSRGLVAA